VVELERSRPWLNDEWKGTENEVACPWTCDEKYRQGGVILTVELYREKFALPVVLEKLEGFRMGHFAVKKRAPWNIQTLGRVLRKLKLNVDFLFA
jgi:hypothetical protein